jgi:ParB-like chromosome segregation protein Spo0J
MTLQPHPAAELFPMMSEFDLFAMVADIKANGQREPIILHEGMILDGRNRYAACQKLGIEPETMDWAGRGDPVAFVISLNLHRRHLSESQRAMVAARLAKLEVGRPKEKPSIEGITTDRAAELLHVGRASVERARTVQEKAAPELAQAVDRGDIPVSTAAKLVHLPKDRQRELAASGKKAAAKSAKQVETRKRAHRQPISPPVPKETEHDKDLRFLRETWAATCASAHAAFLKELGYPLQVVA